MYNYRARVIRVVDGDTLHLEIDLGLDVYNRITVRLDGINAPEMSTQEGEDAKNYLKTLLYAVNGNDPHCNVHTIKDRKEKYGRYRALVYADGSEVSVNDLLVEAGHAVRVKY